MRCLCSIMTLMNTFMTLVKFFSVFSSVVRYYFCLFLLDMKKRE